MYMKKKKIIILSIIIIILLLIILWFNGIIPKQIAKIYSTAYMNFNFPQMELKYDKIEWSPYHASYIINFKDKDNQIYSCVIGPKYFPVNLGQGLFAIEETYEKDY